MALFTDSSISTIEELLAYESSILDVAKTEGIDLTTKLKLAQEEIAVDLYAFLARQNDTWDLNQITLSQPWKLDQIVVTEPLHKWHTFRTLSITYRDAYNRQLNDRYQGKWNEYEALAVWASGALFSAGVGVTSDPVRRARQPQLATVAGECGAATYFVSITWVGPAGSEGAPSTLAALTAPSNSALSVTTGQAPPTVIGWNVYAGYSDTDLSLQNDAVLAPNQTWIEPAHGLRPGNAVGNGQKPDVFLQQSSRRVLERG
jgi:hypothetical protein